MDPFTPIHSCVGGYVVGISDSHDQDLALLEDRSVVEVHWKDRRGGPVHLDRDVFKSLVATSVGSVNPYHVCPVGSVVEVQLVARFVPIDGYDVVDLDDISTRILI